MIEFNDVSKIYDKKPALQHMSLTIETGEFFVIVGTSGSGKTTTLKMINRLLTPTEARSSSTAPTSVSSSRDNCG